MKNLKYLFCTVLVFLTLLSLIVPTIILANDPPTLYTMYINGQEIGIVRFPARALAIYDEIETGLREKYTEEVFIGFDVYFKEIAAGSRQVTNESILTKSIEETVDVKVNAYAVSINGAKMFFVNTLQEAEKVVQEIKAPYIKRIEDKGESKLEEVTIKEDISLDEELISQSQVITPEEAIEMVLNGTEGFREYKVEKGDSLWDIANRNNVKVSDLQLANPDIDNDIIQPGDILKIGRQEKLLTVLTKEQAEYTKEIPFETEVKEDKDLEKGKSKVLQEGEKGEKKIVALITREDGQEIARDIISEEVTKEPIKHIEAKGTKVKPKPQARPTPSRSSNKSSSKSSTKKVSAPSSRGSGSGSDIANYARKFVGYPYKWGTAGPNSFDCSGFTYYVYKQFGIDLKTTGSVAQRKVGSKVSKSDLKPGDIVCFTSSSASGHVGIYIGDGKMVHASGKKTGVKISDINSGSYPKRYVTSRRVVK
ncbi:MAG TPA: NlpC/P60 family protein [Clostridia bacterium]|nr:NlpC/P60 family protein [Clostridia bacterium]